MGKIKSIEYFRVLPRWLFVKVADEDGNHGWGESTLEGHSEAVEGALNALCKRFQGYEADDIEQIWQTAWRLGFYRGGAVFMSAISGIDIALWDLKGRQLGVPIYQLLGGKLRNKISVYAWIGGDRPADVEAAGKARLAQGFRAIKMNATEDVNWLDSPRVLESSVERLKAVKALGLDAALDFHGRLHKPMAKQLAKLAEPYHPLIHRGTPTFGASGGHKTILRPRLDTDCIGVDVLQPDISHCGGISEIRRIAAMAETYDVAIAPHCPLGPISLAASMQVDLTIPNFVIQEMSLGIHYNTEAGSYDITNYVTDPSVFDVKDGYVDALTKPGLGIDIDEEEVRRVAMTAESWPPKGFYGVDGGIREW
ncbi:galactonate dehydratase [Blastomyces dermatitidis ER-3]|uniref:Galactonate dehydratase n=1 Tax=Ajellomyces dermatitidis (strain ER-3 / ATCC MYA-2586) TaxID=559297 RepID=A0ABP2EQV9_AJEDR|nr:galactonate dehydratase [Blastomyces dermatitidis ER-3]EEQ83735.2 galactonate dehydratase [Blastomyces dermatitidis ER-3]